MASVVANRLALRHWSISGADLDHLPVRSDAQLRNRPKHLVLGRLDL